MYFDFLIFLFLYSYDLFFNLYFLRVFLRPRAPIESGAATSQSMQPGITQDAHGPAQATKPCIV